MNNFEDYKVHIQYTFNAFCKVVIRHAAIDIILKLRRRWEREVSLFYISSLPLSVSLFIPAPPDRGRPGIGSDRRSPGRSCPRRKCSCAIK